jgi:hypothetical protein
MICRMDDALCGDPATAGICRPAPEACQETGPVCGCDGKSYDNECAAFDAQTFAWRRGTCESTTEP